MPQRGSTLGSRLLEGLESLGREVNSLRIEVARLADRQERSELALERSGRALERSELALREHEAKDDQRHSELVRHVTAAEAAAAHAKELAKEADDSGEILAVNLARVEERVGGVKERGTEARSESSMWWRVIVGVLLAAAVAAFFAGRASGAPKKPDTRAPAPALSSAP